MRNGMTDEHFGPRGRLWLAAIGLAAACALPRLAGAESARVASFAGQRVLEDPTDVFLFPGTLFLHTDRLVFDYRPRTAAPPDAAAYGASVDAGGGGLTFGTGRIVGVYANRGPLEHAPRRALSSRAASPADYQVYQGLVGEVLGAGTRFSDPPMLMADVLFGLPSGLGVRLSVANTVDDVITTPKAAPAEGEGEGPPAEGEGEGPPAEGEGEGEGAVPPEAGAAGDGPQENGTQYTAVELAAGWPQRIPGRAIDLGAALRFNQIKTVAANDILVESSGTPSLSAAGRMALSLTPRYELAVIGTAQIRNYDLDLPKAKGSVEAGLISLLVGVGPRMVLSDTVTLAATVVVGIDVDSVSAKSGDGAAVTERSERRIVLPGFDMALEAKLRDWLTLRTGLLSRYRLLKVETSREAETVEQAGSERDFRIAAGLGFAFSDFQLDVTLTSDLPFFASGDGAGGSLDRLLGGGTGLVSGLSLSYAWGGETSAEPVEVQPTYQPAAPGYEEQPLAPPPEPVPYDDRRQPYWR